MGEPRVICTRNEIYYGDIRKAMCEGARTKEEVMEKAGVCGECEGCEAELQGVLDSLCGCKEVSMKTVIEAVRNGADTVEKVMEQTSAGTGEDCGKCQGLIANVIELGR